MRRDDLGKYLNRYLRLGQFDDESLNGLQVEGAEKISSVAFAVSACAEAFRKAAERGAQALVVHHGLFWKGHGPEPVTGALAARLKLLIKSDISLFAYHLPLDAHPESGNNAVAARSLGLTKLKPFGDYHNMKIGWKGTLARPVELDNFIARLEKYYGHKASVVKGGGKLLKNVGIVSGGAAKEAMQAAEEGLDLYVTGESSEPVTYLAREAGLNFAALGHYATERVGVMALADHLGKRFGLRTFFIELDNEA